MNEPVLDETFQAPTSLSCPLGEGVPLADVGSLLWVVLRQMVPCDTMALFTLNRAGTHIAARYSAGARTDLLDCLIRPVASGIAGWAALNRRSVLNADPTFDLGSRANRAPALRSSVVVPLLDNGHLVAVLALYSKDHAAFTAAQVTLLELLGPRLLLSLGDTSLPLQIEARAEARLRLVTALPTAEATGPSARSTKRRPAK
jgi:GAF domain-containing protein